VDPKTEPVTKSKPEEPVNKSSDKITKEKSSDEKKEQEEVKKSVPVSEMIKTVNRFNFWVKDYEEAKKWFSEKLSFSCFIDMKYSETGRWIEMGPEPKVNTLTFSLAISDQKKEQVGNEVGDKPLFCLTTNDIEHFYDKMKSNGLEFAGPVETLFYGKQVTFNDLYGNKWIIVQPSDLKFAETDPKESKVLNIVYVTYLAKDLEEAKDWYVNKLGFQVLEDEKYEGGRWIVIGPDKKKPAAFAFQPLDEKNASKLGTQSFLMNISDINSFYEQTQGNGVEYTLKPTHNYGGTDAQFKDLYGNSWNVREHDKGFD